MNAMPIKTNRAILKGVFTVDISSKAGAAKMKREHREMEALTARIDAAKANGTYQPPQSILRGNDRILREIAEAKADGESASFIAYLEGKLK